MTIELDYPPDLENSTPIAETKCGKKRIKKSHEMFPGVFAQVIYELCDPPEPDLGKADWQKDLDYLRLLVSVYLPSKPDKESLLDLLVCNKVVLLKEHLFPGWGTYFGSGLRRRQQEYVRPTILEAYEFAEGEVMYGLSEFKKHIAQREKRMEERRATIEIALENSPFHTEEK